MCRGAAQTRPQPRGSSAVSAVSAMSARTAPAARAVERAAQQLNADLKFPLAGPSADDVERVLEVAGPRKHLGEICGESRAVRQRRKKPSVNTESKSAGRCASSSASRGASAMISATSARSPGLA